MLRRAGIAVVPCDLHKIAKLSQFHGKPPPENERYAESGIITVIHFSILCNLENDIPTPAKCARGVQTIFHFGQSSGLS